MKREKIEDLFLKSLDENISDAERKDLSGAMEADEQLAKDMSGYLIMREEVRRKIPATFGPYFASRVLAKIQNMKIEIDKQIMFFFRRYQLAALGVLVALLTINIVFSDQLNLPSVLGLTDDNTADEELVSFDFYNHFNE